MLESENIKYEHSAPNNFHITDKNKILVAEDACFRGFGKIPGTNLFQINKNPNLKILFSRI